MHQWAKSNIHAATDSSPLVWQLLVFYTCLLLNGSLLSAAVKGRAKQSFDVHRCDSGLKRGQKRGFGGWVTASTDGRDS